MGDEARKPSALDLVENFHVANAIWSLNQLGVLKALTDFVDINALASQFEFDKRTLRQILEFLNYATSYFELEGDRIKLSKDYDEYTEFVFQQYVGAYGPNVVNLSAVLKSPETSGELVDREAHATAFNEIESSSVSLLVSLIQQLELNHVLDLGCGSGTLLIELAKQGQDFCGFGLDMNSNMHREAMKNAEQQGVSDRINLFIGSAFEFHRVLSSNVLDEVQTIVASSLFNECFIRGNNDAIALLKLLKKYFASQPLLVSDYYGCVGHSQANWNQMNALHDWVQIISGQGVPPPDLQTWVDIYTCADCTLIHAIQDQNSSGFVHVVRL